MQTISSQALAEQFHLNAAQIRKDLAYFGEFGVRGVGYYVKELRRHLRQILGLDRHLRVAIMGAGNLGLALADYPGLPAGRLRDRRAVRRRQREDRPRVAQRRAHLRHQGAEEASPRKDRLDIAVIAVPAPHAQPVVDQVVTAGIKAILNFSPGALKVPADVKLKSVDLTVSLESLSFYLAQGEPEWLRSCRTSTRDGKARHGGRRRQGGRPTREALARGEITMSAAALRLIRARRGREGRPAADRAARRHHGRQADRRRSSRSAIRCRSRTSASS